VSDCGVGLAEVHCIDIILLGTTPLMVHATAAANDGTEECASYTLNRGRNFSALSRSMAARSFALNTPQSFNPFT
jgi:hypothetical protein